MPAAQIPVLMPGLLREVLAKPLLCARHTFGTVPTSSRVSHTARECLSHSEEKRIEAQQDCITWPGQIKSLIKIV